MRLALPSDRSSANGSTHVDCDADADGVLDPSDQSPGQPLAVGVDQIGVERLDPHRELVEPARAGEHAHVVRRQALDPQDLLLDLGGEHVDAAHDHHVVAAAGDLLHPPARRVGSARQQPGEVAGAVAHHRHGLLGERGEDQLTLLAVGQHVTSRRVHHLGQEVVLPHVQPVLGRRRLLCHAGTHHLGEPVDVDGVHGAPPLDLGPHLFGPGLGAEDAYLQRGFGRVESLTLHLVRDREEVRRRHHDHARCEVADQLHLPFRHAARHRHHRAAEPLGSVVGPQSAGEQPVAVRDVHEVTRPSTGRPDRTRHQLGPGVDVVAGVADNRRPACRPRRGVYPGYLVTRYGEHAERVLRAQIVLAGKGKPGQVGQLVHVVGMHAGRIPDLAVVVDVGIRVLQRQPQPVELQRPQLVGRRGQCGGGIGSHDLGVRSESSQSRTNAPSCSSVVCSANSDPLAAVDIGVRVPLRPRSEQPTEICRTGPQAEARAA